MWYHPKGFLSNPAARAMAECGLYPCECGERQRYITEQHGAWAWLQQQKAKGTNVTVVKNITRHMLFSIPAVQFMLDFRNELDLTLQAQRDNRSIFHEAAKDAPGKHPKDLAEIKGLTRGYEKTCDEANKASADTMVLVTTQVSALDQFYNPEQGGLEMHRGEPLAAVREHLTDYIPLQKKLLDVLRRRDTLNSDLQHLLRGLFVVFRRITHKEGVAAKVERRIAGKQALERAKGEWLEKVQQTLVHIGASEDDAQKNVNIITAKEDDDAARPVRVQNAAPSLAAAALAAVACQTAIRRRQRCRHALQPPSSSVPCYLAAVARAAASPAAAALAPNPPPPH
jgi:hypothetical protein